ncbi:MAG: N-acetyltransferase [Cyclobacteriaceae bacterium]|nr:N-acetyltransferase [Cyclobacteriaceae bacterium]
MPDGTAHLKFERPEEDTLEYFETYVPESVRKLGIGNEMVEHALQYAISKNLKVIPTCPFVKEFLKKNPAYNRVVV